MLKLIRHFPIFLALWIVSCSKGTSLRPHQPAQVPQGQPTISQFPSPQVEPLPSSSPQPPAVGNPPDDSRVLIPDPALPVFEAWRSVPEDHYFTANPLSTVIGSLSGFLLAAESYQHWYVYGSPLFGASPVYELINRTSGQYYYTMDENEKNILLAGNPSAYLYSGIMGFMYRFQGIGTPEVYRLYKARTGDHLFTSDLRRATDILINDRQDPVIPDWEIQNSLGFSVK